MPGNYIISGGLETVLLIWQLETGSHSTLPHLGAPLEGIVVSPSGSSYAVRLADNSAMILSTAELKPTFSVAGIQLPADFHGQLQLPYVATVDVPEKTRSPAPRLRSLVVSSPFGLLCAVPSATSSRIPSALPRNASSLQTFDLESGHQISKQALARTKATDLNVGPESNTIEEPNVVLMQVCRGGNWLATVDEWAPPKRDLAMIAHSKEQAIMEQGTRREVYLKFWSWNSEHKVYELVSRIDNPHGPHSGFVGQHNRVRDIVFYPKMYGAATIGEDGTVQIWIARPRYRNGSIVKNRKGGHLLDWKCNATVCIDPGALPPQTYTEAKLAYTADQSCLAVACTSPSSAWTIYIVDSYLGTSRTGPYGPYAGPLYGLGIIDRYLIILSDQLQVWNLVTQQLSYGFALRFPQGKQSTLPQISVDVEHGTFAVALPEMDESTSSKSPKKLGSTIIVFEPTDPAPIHVETIPQAVTVLTTLHGPHGYVAVDSAAEIRTLTPAQTEIQSSMALPTPPETPSRSLQDIYGNAHGTRSLLDGPDQEMAFNHDAQFPALSVEPRIDEDDAVVVSSEKLAEVLDAGPGYAIPVTELFERVARLFQGNVGP